jgi:hypothetical protein
MCTKALCGSMRPRILWIGLVGLMLNRVNTHRLNDTTGYHPSGSVATRFGSQRYSRGLLAGSPSPPPPPPEPPPYVPLSGAQHSTEWVGVFRASYTGAHTFRLVLEGTCYLWLGATAVSGYDTSNALLQANLTGSYERSQTVGLLEGEEYPLRMQYGGNTTQAALAASVNGVDLASACTTTIDFLDLVATSSSGDLGAMTRYTQASDGNIFTPWLGVVPQSTIYFGFMGNSTAILARVSYLMYGAIDNWFANVTFIVAGSRYTHSTTCDARPQVFALPGAFAVSTFAMELGMPCVVSANAAWAQGLLDVVAYSEQQFPPPVPPLPSPAPPSPAMPPPSFPPSPPLPAVLPFVPSLFSARIASTAPGTSRGASTGSVGAPGTVDSVFAVFNDVVPGSTGALSLYFGGTACDGGTKLGSSSATYATSPEQATSVAGVILRTPTLWQDWSAFSLAYLLQDAVGRPTVLLTSLAVSTTLASDAGNSTFVCGAPSATTGKGDCAGTVPSAWFPTNASSAGLSVWATVTATYAGVTTATGGSVLMTLARVPTRATLSAAGMYLTLPLSPRFGSDTVGPLTVYAHTGGYSLSSWTLTCSYDTAVLTFTSYTADTKFNLPMTNTATAGTASFAVTGKLASTTDASVTGSAVSLLNLTFTLKAGAGAGVKTNAVSCVANDMIDTGTSTFVSQSAASVGDDRDGWSTAGRLTVTATTPVGVYAYAASAELFNTAPLTGVAVNTSIAALVVYNNPSKADATLASAGLGVTCSGGDAAVIALSATSTGCQASLRANATSGAARTPVLVTTTSGGLVFSGVALRVWAPVAKDLVLSNNVLSGVYGARRANSCSNTLYQSAQLQMLATFGAPGLVPTPQLDVTCTPGLTFYANNASVVSVSGTTVTGLASGSTTLVASNGVTAVSVTVSPTAQVTVANMTAYLLTDATWSGVPGSVSLSPADTFTATANVAQSLTAEAAFGPVITVATLSDGTAMEVTHGGLNISVRSFLADSLSVSMTANGSWSATVPFGASSFSAVDALQVVWTDTCLSSVVARGNGSVAVVLPTALKATATATTLAAPGSPAAAAPVSKPSSAQLSVRVVFPDGSVKNVTTDSRTTYMVTTGANLASVSATGLVSVFPNAVTAGSVRVTVWFPSYPAANELIVFKDFTVAAVASLAVSATPLPTYSGATQAVTTLRRLPCTSAYQRATLKLTATLSDATTVDVTTAASFASNATGVASVASQELWGVSAGAAAVVGTFSGVISTIRTFVVSSTPPAITSLTATLASGTTFTGVVGTTSAMSVTVAFNDTTQFIDAIGGVSASWVTPSSLLNFSSPTPGVVGVSANGTAALYNNAPAAVALQVTRACSNDGLPAANTTLPVFPNLLPGVNDVDLGNATGLPFVPLDAGNTLALPVVVNTGAGNLLSFQITVVWDSTFFTAQSCVVGTGWSTYLFACTIGVVPNQALLVGSSANTTATGAALQVGILTLRATDVTTPAMTVINGTVSVLITTTNGLGIQSTDIVAGAGSVSMNGGVSAALNAHAERRLLLRTETTPAPPVCVPVHGDTNADCRFNAADVLFVQRHLVGQAGFTNLSALTTWQRQQMDQTLDYANPNYTASACGATLGAYGLPCPTAADAQYLLYAVAKKYRFLTSMPTSVLKAPTTRGGALQLTATLVDDTDAPTPCGNLTRVRFAVGLSSGNASANAAIHFSVGSNATLTPSGFLTTAQCGPAGVFRSVADATSPAFDEPYWSVAVLIGAPPCGHADLASFDDASFADAHASVRTTQKHSTLRENQAHRTPHSGAQKRWAHMTASATPSLASSRSCRLHHLHLGLRRHPHRARRHPLLCRRHFPHRLPGRRRRHHCHRRLPGRRRRHHCRRQPHRHRVLRARSSLLDRRHRPHRDRHPHRRRHTRRSSQRQSLL